MSRSPGTGACDLDVNPGPLVWEQLGSRLGEATKRADVDGGARVTGAHTLPAPPSSSRVTGTSRV